MPSVSDYDRFMRMSESESDSLITYIDAKEKVLGLKGTDYPLEDGYRRFSAEERKIMMSVNDGVSYFSNHSTGLELRFSTDSIHIFVKGENDGLFDMTNETFVGECGMSLYVYHEKKREFVLHDVLRFPLDKKNYDVNLCHFKERKTRKYILYLPLYMGVKNLSIGLDKDSSVEPFGFSLDKKILIYGTSITHGCSASHPGMSYANIISRKLDAEVINLGFSGCGMMELEMAEIISKRNMDILIIDTEPNAGCSYILRDNIHKFLDIILSLKPDLKIIIASRTKYALDDYDESVNNLRKFYKKYLKDVVNEYKEKGYHLSFVNGSDTIKKNYAEYTCDGIHPDDYGMLLIAESFIKEIKKVL